MSGQPSSQLDPPVTIDRKSLNQEDVERLSAAEAEHPFDLVREDVSEELSLDKKFELLKNQRRRRVLRFLMQNGEASTTGELAEHVAVLENAKESVNELTSQERKAAYVGLYQCHLPKMDDYGVIRFNQARGRVELAERANQLEEYLEQQPERPWPLVYLGLAATGATIYTVTSFLGVTLLPSLIAGLTLFAIATTGAVHWQKHRTKR